ncbi:MAG TPA: histidine phosphatase family protein [Candidatus Corynebacterium avicola]|uniref:Histidine phosphatase family protein n=1 Tax=Candidatus Corynebacterium avicola TaxID=2838527 RepID=A0A9D1UKL5_9CORY|nr:histidine phosphatase family protein [Candidatus Corynebacterium avicola]
MTHPEATHHVDGQVGDWFDSALTERGLSDATRIAKSLREDLGVGAGDGDGQGTGVRIISSDLLRIRQTAEVTSDALGVPVELETGLREKSYGVVEGRPQSRLDERFITPPAVGERMDHDEGIEGAETKLEWFTRVYAAMNRFEEAENTANTASDLVIVTHGGTATPVIASWMRIPLEACDYAAFRVSSGSISVLTEDDHFHNRSLTVLGLLPGRYRNS